MYRLFRFQTGNKEIVAIKCMDKRSQKHSFIDRVVTEIALLKVVKSEYIVQLIDFELDPKYYAHIIVYISTINVSM